MKGNRYILLLLLAAVPLIAPARARAQDKITTVAGRSAVTGYTNGFGTNSVFNDPAGLARDAVGNLYVADSANHVVRKISTNGSVSHVAGSPGNPGYVNGAALAAQFDTPSALCVDALGNVFVSDTGNHVVRKISPNGTVSLLAGTPGVAGATNGTATAAQFNGPLGLALAPDGSLFVADTGNHLLRKISNGVVGSVAGLEGTWGYADGNGTNARLNGPVGLAFSPTGELYVADTHNHVIRKLTGTGELVTIAGLAGQDGGVDGPALSAHFTKPADITFDSPGNLFIADSFNHIIRRLDTNGIVRTIAGRPGSNGSADGVNGIGRLFNPYSLAFDAAGRLFVSDTYNQTIREVLVPFELLMQRDAPGNIIRLTWPSILGARYRVQCRDAADSAWSDLSPMLEATAAETIFNDTASQPVRLYRVLLID